MLPRLLRRIQEQVGERLRAWTDEDGTRRYQRGVAVHACKRYRLAYEQWHAASLRGNLEARYRLGLMYLRGEGVLKSLPDAVRWLDLAAAEEHSDAQYQLGLIYLSGGQAHVNPDYRHAAEADDLPTRKILNCCFLMAFRSSETPNLLFDGSKKPRQTARLQHKQSSANSTAAVAAAVGISLPPSNGTRPRPPKVPPTRSSVWATSIARVSASRSTTPRQPTGMDGLRNTATPEASSRWRHSYRQAKACPRITTGPRNYFSRQRHRATPAQPFAPHRPISTSVVFLGILRKPRFGCANPPGKIIFLP